MIVDILIAYYYYIFLLCVHKAYVLITHLTDYIRVSIRVSCVYARATNIKRKADAKMREKN